ncbi:MAG: N-acetyltransferase [Phycisphaerales bacterium]|nr:N-acetyltransferase [Phycisphaerales bacterium]
MDEDPFSGWGLRSVELADRAVLDPYFTSLSEPLSDYTFSQLFTWRNSLRILWKMIDGHLCVFANGTGDLTLLLPPIGDTHSDRALKGAYELMDDYNVRHGVPHRSRVEYASEELLARFDPANMHVRPMGADYLYDSARMIDLAGGDLASKRQAKNRFLRNYPHRVEAYSRERHLADCMQLLDTWKIHQDAQHLEEPDSNALKRAKESVATALCLETAEVLGLKGMVVYVRSPSPFQGEGRGEGGDVPMRAPGVGGKEAEDDCKMQIAKCKVQNDGSTDNQWRLGAFTFGEALGTNQSSITIEKTDLAVKGLAQFIFSDFCRQYWAHLPLVNVGDDWGLESLAWTKQSYRPVKMLRKFVLRREPAIVSATGFAPSADARPVAAPVPNILEELLPAGDVLPVEAAAMDNDAVPRAPILIRSAQKGDLPAALALELATFSAHAISKRQMQYLQQRDSAVFLVAEKGGQVVGDGIALLRNQKGRVSGRVYSLVVSDAHRGQRIGQKLLRAMLEELAKRGAGRVYLEVEQSNAAAIRLYEQNGFRRIGVLPDYYDDGQHAVHMMHEATNPQKARLVSKR